MLLAFEVRHACLPVSLLRSSRAFSKPHPLANDAEASVQLGPAFVHLSSLVICIMPSGLFHQKKKIRSAVEVSQGSHVVPVVDAAECAFAID
jgi:hypothetical protein